MMFDVSTVMFWLLFLALFPISFTWFRRAYRILRKKDYSEVALSRGVPPPNAERYAPFTAAVNLIAGLSIAFVILSVVMFGAFGIVLLNPDFQSWVAVAGSTLWMKIIFDFLISQQAKMFNKRQNKQSSNP
jgi:cytochrome c biogenesis protein CcdA